MTTFGFILSFSSGVWSSVTWINQTSDAFFVFTATLCHLFIDYPDKCWLEMFFILKKYCLFDKNTLSLQL